eukprot:13474330-Alexandrium_andersonii.AAC.1
MPANASDVPRSPGSWVSELVLCPSEHPRRQRATCWAALPKGLGAQTPRVGARLPGEHSEPASFGPRISQYRTA